MIVGTTIFIAHRTKNHLPLIYVQLFCITWISAFLQWSIGSMEHSGLVIAWSFLGPLGALIFLSPRQAVIWMLMFIGIVIISAVFNPQLLGYTLTVPRQTKIMFYTMNLGVSSTVVFIASIWFVNTIKTERSRSERLLGKIQTLFGQHVSKEIAEELISKDPEQAGSKIHDVTVMFLDIRDFTLFADSKAPNEVAAFQNTVFSEFINIVRDHKGIVIQLLGDGIYAVFGAPISNASHARDAVNAGFKMIERTKELSDSGTIPEIKLGIGLHAGNVMAGELGNEYRKAYSLAGSNVIIAARIEQLNKELKSQFLISEAVFQKTHDLDYSHSYKGEHRLKGISNPIGIYQLV